MIKSETFGGVVFSGDDARKFANQVRFGKAPQAAHDAIRRGDELLNNFRGKASERHSGEAHGEAMSVRNRAKA